MFRYCDKSLTVTLLTFPNSVTISDYHCMCEFSTLLGVIHKTMSTKYLNREILISKIRLF